MERDKIYNRFVENGYYTEVPEIVTPDIKKLFKDYHFLIMNNNYLKEENNPDFVYKSAGKYGIMASELLLLYFTDIYSKIVNKKLVPTYSFTRVYNKGALLLKHSDRPSCQYSITINIGASSDEPWPFFCRSKTMKKTSEIYNDLYTPIIYMGEKVSHWRDSLTKESSTHIFLHYVDGDDPAYREYWYDKREFIG